MEKLLHTTDLFRFLDSDKLQQYVIERLENILMDTGRAEGASLEQFQEQHRYLMDFKRSVMPCMHALLHLQRPNEANKFTPQSTQIELEEQYQKKLCELTLSLMLFSYDVGTADHVSSAENFSVICEIFVLTLKLCNQAHAALLLDEVLKLSLSSLKRCFGVGASEQCSSALLAESHQRTITLPNIVQLLCHLFSEPLHQPETEILHSILNHDTEQFRCVVQIKMMMLTVLHVVDDFMVVKILMDLFPKINAKFYSSAELKEFQSKTWDIVMECFHFNEVGRLHEIHPRSFLILSCISDQIFSNDFQLCEPNQAHSYPVWATVHFCQILQYGLVHSNPLQRKRTLYFLKRALDCLQSRNADIPPSVFGGLLDWKQTYSAEIQKIFSDIILVLETLEEKQVHVITPLLPVISNLIILTNENDKWFLHTSWLGVIFQRLLQHDSKTIRRWAIEKICNISFEHFPFFRQGFEKFLLFEFLDALNDTSLYSRQPNESLETCTIIGDKIQKLYLGCHHALCTTEKQAQFFQLLLHRIQSRSWGAVALLYISRALASLPASPLWNLASVNDLREVLINTLRTHEVVLRCAIQGFLLEAFMKFTDLKNLTIYDISTLVAILKKDECIKRGSSLYNQFVKWLHYIIINAEKEVCPHLTKDAAVNFTKESLKSLLEDNVSSPSEETIIIKESREVLRVVRMIVMLSDGKILEVFPKALVSNIQTYFEPLMNILLTCHCRPYMPSGKIDKSLQVLLTLATEVKQVANGLPEDLEKFVSSFSEAMSATYLPYATNRLLNKDSISYGSIQLHFDFLEYMAKTCTFNITLHICMTEMCQRTLQMLAEGTESSFMKHYIAVRSFNVALTIVIFSDDKQDRLKTYGLHDFMKLTLKNNKLYYMPRDINGISFADRTHKTNPNQIHSNYISTLWHCIEKYVRLVKLEIVEEDILLEQCLHAQEIGSSESLKIIFDCLELFLSQIIQKEVEKVVRILEISWKTLFEMKLNVDFWQAMDSFIRMAFQPSLMNNDTIAKHLYEYASKIHERSESCQGLFVPLIQRVCEVWKQPENQSSILKNIELVVQALTFGHVHRKDQRLIQDTVKFVVQENSNYINHLSDSYHLYEFEVRVQMIVLLLKLENNAIRSEILSCLVSRLLDYEEKITKTRTRHFANSLIHRVKHRVWQSILVLEPMNPEKLDENLLEIIFVHLVEESLQPSVRYIMEWLTLRILYRKSEMTYKLWEAFEWASQRRIGSLGSFLAIICNMAEVLPNTNYKIDFIQKVIPLILPWCTAQHFNTRIYAQVALNKIWKCCQTNNFEVILVKYSPIEHLFTVSAQHCGTSKGTQKLLESYNFGGFHHLKHYTLETIFYELPRLSNMTPEEWIEPSLFEKCDPALHLSSDSCIALYNSDNDLAGCESGSFLVRTADNLLDSAAREHKDVQKKAAPWKQMIPDYETLAASSETIALRKKQCLEGLIVVASLIDRPTNLGGLCRTCEVFGVSEYIIGSLQYTEDKQFQSLSVSAERWVLIKEVKVHNLKDYLMAMKKCGYKIIGAEQTANSCKLDKFRFPKKSLLVLGNEKEGIPVEIIQLLDICIEVPQLGLIRSLNVHVTGAILIWEYTRQHLT